MIITATNPEQEEAEEIVDVSYSGEENKNVFGSYFHGPILSRNANLAYRLVTTALKKKYGQDIQLPAYEDILSQEIAEEYSDVKSKADFS